jgi:hypothetical protein
VRSIGLSLAAAALAALAFTATPPGRALACSAGPDWNPVAQSDVIVAGRVAGWQPAQADLSPQMFQPIRLTIAVDQMVKGASTQTIEAIDAASLLREDHAADGSWAGSSGACGAFNADPAGMYVVLGLTHAPDGSLRTNLLLNFYTGTEPPGGFRLERMREVLGSFGLMSLPALGSGGYLAQTDSASDSFDTYAPAFIGWAVVAVLTAFAYRHRSRQKSSRKP